MTDTNIIHALQCCGVETNCRNCPLYEERSADCIYTVLKNALDLITRQQCEIVKQKCIKQLLREDIKTAKSEAVKEFAERLKERIYNGGVHPTVEDEVMCDIDNLVKEMVGEEE